MNLLNHALLGLAFIAALAGPAAQAASGPLDWAFRFASAVKSDPVDQAKAQEKVVREYLTLGAMEEATRCVDSIQGWRRGTAWAAVAVAFAQRGQTNAATDAIRQAEIVQRAFRTDWQGLRVAANVARAYAALGEIEKSRAVTAGLPGDEATKGLTAIAGARLKAGHVDATMQELKNLEGTQDFDRNFQLLDGYLEIAQHPVLAEFPVKREQALDGAARVLVTMPPLRRGEVGPEIARGYQRAGATAKARTQLETLETEISAWTLEPRFQSPALARLALAWREVGDQERCRRLLSQAKALATTGELMDQPATCAAVAAVFVECDERATAWQLYDSGLTIAAGFGNARPRALSVAELCLSMGRQRLELNDARGHRLEELFAGLKDPW